MSQVWNFNISYVCLSIINLVIMFISHAIAITIPMLTKQCSVCVCNNYYNYNCNYWHYYVTNNVIITIQIIITATLQRSNQKLILLFNHFNIACLLCHWVVSAQAYIYTKHELQLLHSAHKLLSVSHMPVHVIDFPITITNYFLCGHPQFQLQLPYYTSKKINCN